MSLAEDIRTALFAEADADYKAFHAKLVPNVAPERIIGVRIPTQRKIAKRFSKDPRVQEYMALTAHDYMEEINVHGFFIADLMDEAACLAQINAFLPMLDNWATCDTFSPKLFKKQPTLVEQPALAWMNDKAHPYTVRFGINMLMQHCLDDATFKPEQLAAVASCACEDYYINMGVAWYFSMALVKQWDVTLPWISERRMPDWVHRKSIQKAIESRRISPERKALLKSYR